MVTFRLFFCEVFLHLLQLSSRDKQFYHAFSIPQEAHFVMWEEILRKYPACESLSMKANLIIVSKDVRMLKV